SDIYPLSLHDALPILRAAPAAGAVLMALVSTRLPPWKHPGRVLLAVVASYGLATIAFGVSKSFPLSLLLLALGGALDNVSVIIRSEEHTSELQSLRHL